MGGEKLSRRALRPGPLETPAGERVGEHAGVHRFTVGQRRGLGAQDGAPRYVLRIVPERAAVVAGTGDEALVDRCALAEPRWLLGEHEARPARVTAKLRFKHRGVGARVALGSSGAAELAPRSRSAAWRRARPRCSTTATASWAEGGSRDAPARGAGQ